MVNELPDGGMISLPQWSQRFIHWPTEESDLSLIRAIALRMIQEGQIVTRFAICPIKSHSRDSSARGQFVASWQK
jgi:hypothetical protein